MRVSWNFFRATNFHQFSLNKLYRCLNNVILSDFSCCTNFQVKSINLFFASLEIPLRANLFISKLHLLYCYYLKHENYLLLNDVFFRFQKCIKVVFSFLILLLLKVFFQLHITLNCTYAINCFEGSFHWCHLLYVSRLNHILITIYRLHLYVFHIRPQTELKQYNNDNNSDRY